MKTNLACWLQRGALTALLAAPVNATPTRAADISYAGTMNNVQSGWRYVNFGKPLDLDGDNIFGTDGYFMVNRAPVLPNYVESAAILTSTYPGNSLYYQIDDPTNDPERFITGTMNPFPGTGLSADIFQFTLNTNAVGRTIRVGLMVDNLDIAAYNAASLTLVQTSGAGTTNGPIDTTSPVFNDRNPDWVFFDLTGTAAGDTFIVRGTGGINGAATLGGVSFDSLIITLGTSSLLEGPAAGGDGVTLVSSSANAPWNNVANAPWLHLSSGSQTGMGSTNIAFTFDANTNGTRTGTLTIAGQTLTVTQAGASFAAANPLPLVTTNLFQPYGVAVDSAGNVYFADTGNNAIKRWNAANNTISNLVTTGLALPYGVAVDGAGNAYISDTLHNAIKKWTAASHLVTTLATNLNSPTGVAVDNTGNVYFADSGNSIKKWLVASNSVTTLVGSGLTNPGGVAVDSAGNVYIANNDGTIKQWTAATSTLTTLISSAQGVTTSSDCLAVDGAGNVYFSDLNSTPGNALKRFTPGANTITTLYANGMVLSHGLAVDAIGNVFTSDAANNTVEELPRVLVDLTPRWEPLTAGSDTIADLMPAANINLYARFLPVSDAPWMNFNPFVNPLTNGGVGIYFSANDSGLTRTAHLNLFGQSIPVMQLVMLEGPQAGSNSISFPVPAGVSWTAMTNVPWLRLDTNNLSGTGPVTLTVNFNSNSGDTRTGTVTINGQTVSVTQSGSNYVAAGAVTLVSAGLYEPGGVAVDGAGNVYVSDIYDAIHKWTAPNGPVTILVSSNLLGPFGVAVDTAGNVYIADTDHNAIKKWTVATGTMTTLVSAGLYQPYGLAVDSAGNVYIADTENNAIKKWTAATDTVTTLVSSGLNNPVDVAVDSAGNVYIADTENNAIKKWTVATGTMTTLVSAGLYRPYCLAVDSAGNVYIADTDNNAIKKWTVLTRTVTTLVSSGLDNPFAVALDSTGNVYIADTYNNAIKVTDQSPAFVDPTPKRETSGAGTDSLPVVLPVAKNLSGYFVSTSDQPWLTITGTNGGIVSFAFTANTAVTSRTAHITLLGNSIPVTQTGVPLVLGNPQILGNGSLQFNFTSGPSANFTVLSSTNLSLPLAQWTAVQVFTNASGTIQFTDPSATNNPQRFYRVSSP